MAEHFIQKAEKRMEEKGTKGKFGKATPAKIAEGKREGGVKKKEAVFAENMKKIASKNKGEGVKSPTHVGRDGRHQGEVGHHKAITSQKGYTHDCSK